MECLGERWLRRGSVVMECCDESVEEWVAGWEVWMEELRSGRKVLRAISRG